MENECLTCAFIIQNHGNTPAAASDHVVVTDILTPVLDSMTVTFNGIPWTEGTNYTYCTSSGTFETAAGQISVPPASYCRDPAAGSWLTTPGFSILMITGRVSDAFERNTS